MDTVKSEQGKMQTMKNFLPNTKKISLVVDANQPRREHPFDTVFQIFGNFPLIHRQLKHLVYHLQKEEKCLVDVNQCIKPFVACYKFNPTDPRASGKSSRLFVELHKHIQFRTMDAWNYLRNSAFREFIPFWLKAIWSIHYCKNAELSLQFEMSDIKWTHIPVSSFEVVTWHDMIWGIIVECRHTEYVCDQWLKYWALKCFKIMGLIQILKHMISQVQIAIADLGAAIDNA